MTRRLVIAMTALVAVVAAALAVPLGFIVSTDQRQAFVRDLEVQALQAAETSAQSLVDSTRLGYQVGVTINLDVLDAQSQLFQTRRDLALARYEVLVGGLRLKQASGLLGLSDLQAINTLLVKP